MVLSYVKFNWYILLYGLLSLIETKSIGTEPISIAIVVCEKQQSEKIKILPNTPEKVSKFGDKNYDFDRQLNQTVVLIKSLLMTRQLEKLGHQGLEKSLWKLKIYIFTNAKKNFRKVNNNFKSWDKTYTENVSLHYKTTKFPEGFEWMRLVFAPCANLRLFLHILLPKVERILYLDTDIIFLRPIIELWDYFNHFQHNTLFGMVQGSSVVIREGTSIYGTYGLNSGVMLIHLPTLRMQKGYMGFLGSTKVFMNTSIAVYDQFIINQYLLENSKILQPLVLPCNWNFRSRFCFENSYCDIDNFQLNLIHGLRLGFSEHGDDKILYRLFKSFENFELTNTSNFSIYPKMKSFYVALKTELIDAILQDTSYCKNQKNFATNLIKGFLSLLDPLRTFMKNNLILRSPFVVKVKN